MGPTLSIRPRTRSMRTRSLPVGPHTRKLWTMGRVCHLATSARSVDPVYLRRPLSAADSGPRKEYSEQLKKLIFRASKIHILQTVTPTDSLCINLYIQLMIVTRDITKIET